MLDRLEDECDTPLTPMERVILSSDGTVTHAVEALARTYINVNPVNRTRHEDELYRSAILQRNDNDEEMVYASSIIYLEHVDDEMAEELTNGTKGIGDLLRERGQETHRSIEEMNARHVADDEMPHFVKYHPPEYLERTYTINSDGEELMQITEWFPRCKY